MVLGKKKRYKNLTMRRAKTANSVGARNDIPNVSQAIATAVHSGSTLNVTFDTPVVYSGNLPAWTNNSQTVIGVTVTDPLHATLTFSGATAAGDTVIPFQDLAFRTNSGGFVQSGTIVAT